MVHACLNIGLDNLYPPESQLEGINCAHRLPRAHHASAAILSVLALAFGNSHMMWFPQNGAFSLRQGNKHGTAPPGDGRQDLQAGQFQVQAQVLQPAKVRPHTAPVSPHRVMKYRKQTLFGLIYGKCRSVQIWKTGRDSWLAVAVSKGILMDICGVQGILGKPTIVAARAG